MRPVLALILGAGLLSSPAWSKSDPAPADSLPYVDRIRLGPPAPCVTCPPPAICPERPIPFSISGTLPGSCYQFRGLELLPSLIASPFPAPPIVRAYVAYNDCLGMPCDNVPVTWQANAMLPGLPHGTYHVIVQLAEVSWCDTARTPITLHSTSVPFSVAERCSLPPSDQCYLHDWSRGTSDAACDARVGPGTPGRVTFDMHTGTALAGLQGHLSLDPAALAITRIRPVGIAERMQIAWNATPDGADFVLFSTSGRTFRSACIPPATCPPGAAPVFEVTVTPRAGMPIPPLTRLDVTGLLAADSLGREVHPCPTFAPVSPARICAGRNCDFNADGHLDVRDLVLMARCVLGVGACPDSAASVFDCDGDGGLDVDDVLCCARVILHGPLPDSLPTRPAPGLRVALGTPVISSAGLELPLRVSGADLVGSARLQLSVPAGVYASAELELLGDASSWLAVDELSGGELLLGLVALAPASQTAGELDLRIRLTTAPGQSASPDVRLLTAEFVAPDGAPLAHGTLGAPPPTGVQRFALSAARPNPFGRETRFVVSVASDAEAEVGIFDLAGRLVTRLHRGALTAGEHSFRWDGSRADGARAPDGLYFYRVQGMGERDTRRLVLIRSR